MYELLNRCIGEMEVNLTDKEITKAFHEYFQIIKRVSEEYTDDATAADVRADHPEYGFLDHGKMRMILEQAKVMRGTRESDDEYLAADDMQELLRRNENWGKAGSGQQRSWIQTAAMRGMNIEELAGMVWVCTEYGSIDDIESTMREYLKEKREKEKGSCDAEDTSGYDVEFAEECIKAHMGAFKSWPFGNVKKIGMDGDGNLRIHYVGGMYWHYKEEGGEIIWW